MSYRVFTLLRLIWLFTTQSIWTGEISGSLNQQGFLRWSLMLLELSCRILECLKQNREGLFVSRLIEDF
jgi:hypothetical protein